MGKMNDKAIMGEIMDLINQTSAIVVSSVDDNGFPNSKLMYKMEHDGMKSFLFSTNTSSMRVGQFKKNPKANLYFCGQSNGLMLIGEMEVCTDRESREKLWTDGAEIYYPLGVDDPDYSVLRFTAKEGNYYNKLKKHIFDVE